jgi:hypothetical protein
MEKEKQNKKYVTLEEGEDFRTIAKIMTEHGFVMNHATARNQLITSLEKLLMDFSERIRDTRSKIPNVEKMMKEHSLNDDFSDMLYLTYKSYLEDVQEENNGKK